MKTLHKLQAIALPFAALCLLSAAPAHAADGTFSSKTTASGDSAGNPDTKTTEKSTDDAGTTATSTSKEKDSVSANGDVSISKSSETTNDPKGLGNKSSTDTTEDTSVNVERQQRQQGDLGFRKRQRHRRERGLDPENGQGRFQRPSEG